MTDARGTFDILHDSLYFRNVYAALTGSRLTGSGRYNFDNDDLRLRPAWHPVALVDELGTAPNQVTVVNEGWAVRRTEAGFSADPAPYGLRERWGVLWLAPARPVVDLFDDPDAEDAGYVGAWLPPVHTGAGSRRTRGKPAHELAQHGAAHVFP